MSAADLRSMADQPNTLREYETIFILRPETANDAIAQINGRLKSVVEPMGGKVLKLENWGKRRLAYEIRKQLKGIYLYWRYLSGGNVVAEVERNLRMLDNVIRYYTVKVDADIDPTARPSELTDESWAKAATTAADEEELVTGRAGFADEEAGDDDAELAGDDEVAEQTESAEAPSEGAESGKKDEE